MKIRLISFTDRGQALAEALAGALPGEAVRCSRPVSLDQWTQRAFSEAEALVFVGAAGIAVRAIAPYLKNKAEDPAVVVVDETGRYAVPVLSGHLGGANSLAMRIAALCGAEPVITTATDRNGVFAVDEWARVQGCAVRDPDRIKAVSARLLSGGEIRIRSDWPVHGTPPRGVRLTHGEDCDVLVTVRTTDRDVLRVVPRIVAVGVGCRQGTPEHAIEAAYQALLEKGGLDEKAVSMVCTIDRKAEEPGLLEFCAARGLPLNTYPAQTLRAVEGSFSASAFVEKVTGVDNVCERSAVLGCGGALFLKKEAGGGVTMAAAMAPANLDWRPYDG